MQKWKSVSVSNDNVLRAWSLCIHPLSDHSYQSLPFLLLVIHLQVLFLLHRVFLQMSSTVYSTLSIHGAGKWAWHTAKGGKYCWLWCDSAYGGDEGAAFFFDLRRPQMQHLSPPVFYYEGGEQWKTDQTCWIRHGFSYIVYVLCWQLQEFWESE